jgi:hypothetical protein
MGDRERSNGIPSRLLGSTGVRVTVPCVEGERV